MTKFSKRHGDVNSSQCAALTRFHHCVQRRLLLEQLEERCVLATFFDQGGLALSAENPAGVVEPAVPIHHNGTLIADTNHQVIEAFDQVPGTSNFPLTFVDLHANTFLRPTYQFIAGTNGGSGTLGTSFVASPSIRLADETFRFISTVTRGDVNTDGVDRYESILTAEFTGLADVTSTRRFPDPAVGETVIDVDINFQATAEIALATAAPFPNNDRFRVATISSMFSRSTQFDANVIRYEDDQGNVRTISLTDDTPRGAHLLAAPAALGSWVELIKTDGSTWFPTSPSMRVEIVDAGGLQLGVQGFLDNSTLTSDDSLSVWFEVVDAADTIANGTNVDVSFRVVATPPRELDFGDGPDPLNTDTGRYPSRIESDGARHLIDAAGPYLGQIAPDAETNAQQNEQFIAIANADFDQVQVSSTDPTPLELQSGHFTIGLGDTTVREGSNDIGTAFVPEWTAISGTDGSRGISNPGGLFSPELESSDYALFTQGPFGIAEQILNVTPQPNTIYTLSVDAGDQVFLNLDPNPQVGLFVDGLELSGGTTVFTPPADGGFSTLTRTYATGDVVPSGPLAIRLGSTSSSFFGQVWYNNVRLSTRTAAAGGDDLAGIDDEDGLLSLRGQSAGDGALLADDPYTVTVQVSGAGVLSAFADFNRDGDWDDDGEQIAADVAFDANSGSDRVEITGTVPSDAGVGSSVLRLRVDSIGGLGPRGLATDGEVEDHPLELVSCPLVVTNTGDSGVGSLRDAIACANSISGKQTIEFDLPADAPNHVYYRDDSVDGEVALQNVTTTAEADDANIADIDPDWPHSWWVFSPQSAYPNISDVVDINGYSQTGAQANTNPVGQGLNTVLRIEIQGGNAGEVPNGLFFVRNLDPEGSTIRGLAINRTLGPKIRLENPSDIRDGNSRVEGSFIGPEISGTRAFDESAGFLVDLHGIDIRTSDGNIIGGLLPEQRNLISANVRTGVLSRGSSSNTRIEGNLLGTDRSGTAALGNLEAINTGNQTIVGGTDPAARNVISANSTGIRMQGRESIAQNNLIGTDVTGTQPLGNQGPGILIPINSRNHQIIENIIAFNNGGVLIDSGDAVGNGNRVSRNSIYSNGGGISLNGRGDMNDVPPESDPPDQDVGPNGLQNYPVLTSVTENGGGTRIAGTLPSTPNSQFRIEFFANRERLDEGFNTGAFSEGETFVGSIDVTTDADGFAGFTADVDPLPADQPYVTATATDVTDDSSGPRNNTSQFSMVEPLGGCSFTVTSTAATGPGTLRETVACANLTVDAQTITFDISPDDPGHLFYLDDGVPGQVSPANAMVTTEADDAKIVGIDPDFPHSWHVIRPEKPLPSIVEPVIIDGGGRSNTIPAPGPLDTRIGVELNGCLAMEGNGLHFGIGSEGSRVQGLAINCWLENGILIDGFGSVTVAGDFIGTDVSGFIDRGNGNDGVLVFEASLNTLGGTAPGDRNLISGNDNHGIEIFSIKLVSSNDVQGNVIGPDRSLVPTIGNSNSGVVIVNGFNNLVGGTTTGAANVINGNGAAGITLLQDPGEVSVRNAFLGNHIGPVNGGLGIDLGGDGATMNDLDDPATTSEVETDLDGGANQQQNFPTLVSATTNGTTEIVFSLQSLPVMDFRLEFFASPTLDPSGFGEGASFLGATDVTTDNFGNSTTVSFTLPMHVPVGQFITSTATRLNDLGNNTAVPIETSEFSAGVEVRGQTDFGDAPAGYGTLRVDDGARHIAVGPTLGTERDIEGDANQFAPAGLDGTADDLTNTGSTDDEDGVDFGAGGAVLPVGQIVPVDVAIRNSAGNARLFAWIDFNGNGDFRDDGEQIADGTGSFANLGNGIVTLNVTAPATGFGGTSYARFRVSTDEGLDFDGQASDGEVEDYQAAIINGDAVSIDLSGGEIEVVAEASEILIRQAGNEVFRKRGVTVSGFQFLGTDGDNRVGLGNLASALPSPVPLVYDGSSGQDSLVLIESDQVFDLTDTLNQLTSIEVIDIVGASPNALTIDGQSVIRSTDAANMLVVIHDDDDTVTYGGDGWEVQPPIFVDGQQHHVLTNSDVARVETINLLPFQNPFERTDVNFSGATSSLDALQIINFLGRFDSVSSVDLTTPTSESELPERYYDVNGSRTATALDALNVINFIGRLLTGGLELEIASLETQIPSLLPIQTVAAQTNKSDVAEPNIEVHDTALLQIDWDISNPVLPWKLDHLTLTVASASDEVTSDSEQWDLALQDLLPLGRAQ